MRILLCALLLAAACKSGDKTPSTTESPTPTERGGSTTEKARTKPALPGAGGVPNIVNGDDPKDWNDPALREEMEKKREERRKKMDEQLDTNHDGVVSPEEHQVRMQPMFDRLDANSDGKLTPDELAASDRRMGFDDPAAVDTNKDGQISLGELDVAMTARRAEMRTKWRGGGGRGHWTDDGAALGSGN